MYSYCFRIKDWSKAKYEKPADSWPKKYHECIKLYGANYARGLSETKFSVEAGGDMLDVYLPHMELSASKSSYQINIIDR